MEMVVATEVEALFFVHTEAVVEMAATTQIRATLVVARALGT